MPEFVVSDRDAVLRGQHQVEEGVDLRGDELGAGGDRPLQRHAGSGRKIVFRQDSGEQPGKFDGELNGFIASGIPDWGADRGSEPILDRGAEHPLHPALQR